MKPTLMFIGLAIALTSQLSSAMSINFPILEEITRKKGNNNVYSYLPLARLNESLKAKGSKVEFPYYITVKNPKEADAELKKLDAMAKEAAKVLKRDIDILQYQSLGIYTKASLPYRLCYGLDASDKFKNDEDHAKKVALFLGKFADLLLSDQLVLLGSRYKTEGMYLDDNMKDEDQEDWPENWVDWRGKGEAVVVLNTDDDDGTHLNDDVVRFCTFENNRFDKVKDKPVKKRRKKS